MPAKRKRPPGGGAADLRRRGKKGVLVAFTPEQLSRVKRAAGKFDDERRHVSLWIAGLTLAAVEAIEKSE